MTTLKIIRRDGAECILDVTDGKSIMETLRDHGVDELMALCGGCCSCATCHIYVDPQYAVGLPPMSDDENDLLDSSYHSTASPCHLPRSEERRIGNARVSPRRHRWWAYH